MPKIKYVRGTKCSKTISSITMDTFLNSEIIPGLVFPLSL